MEIEVVSNYQEISQKAAEIVIKTIKEKPNALICFPTGSTPLRMYELLIKANKAGEVDFSQVRVASVDEYYGLSCDHHQSYAYFLHKNFFDHVNLKGENIFLIKGDTDNPERECTTYQYLIDKAGGIDLYLDGIGENGHIGFNEPSDKLTAFYHLERLSENTKAANARFFTTDEVIPSAALTIGIAGILNAKKSIFLSTGDKKIKAWERYTSNDDIDPQFPMSFLKLAKNAIAIVDHPMFK